MKKARILVPLLIIVLIGGLIYKNTSTHKDNSLTVAIMMPLEGQFGAVGEGLKNGAILAVEDFRTAHPDIIINTPIENDKFDTKTGYAAFTKLTTIDHVQALLMVSTPVIDAYYEKMQQAGIPIASVGLQNNGIADDNIFQLTAEPKAETAKFAKKIDGIHHKKIGIIHETQLPASVSFYEAFLANYTGEHEDFLIKDTSDARSLATKIKASGVDSLVFLDTPTLGAALTKELIVQGVTPTNTTFYYDAQLQTGQGEYEKLLGSLEAINGAKALQYLTPDITAFKNKYKARFGTDSTPFAEYGYDGMMTLLATKAKDSTSWVQNLKTFSGDTYTGPMKFDSRGIRIQETAIWQVKDGKIVAQ